MMWLTSSFLLTASLFTAATTAKYTLAKDYSGSSFIDSFDYYNGPDPTNGHVQFKGFATANATGLTGFLLDSNSTSDVDNSTSPPVYLGVDYTNKYADNVGRPSLHISSVDTYNHSLIIADIVHMPSACGVWPAFWLLGTSAVWPLAGEIDIIENVNDYVFNTMTLHTDAGVTVSNDTNLFNGTLKTSNCDVNAKEQEKNVGCSILDKPETNSYGNNFNKQGGGVYAMQYTPEYIAIWFFPRSSIPGDIKANTPSPPHMSNMTTSTWGKPNALFKLPNTFNTTFNSSMTNTGSRPPRPPPTSTSSITTSTSRGNTIIPIPSGHPTKPPGNSTHPPSQLTKHFTSLNIHFSTTFCGDWAGKVWNATTSSCSTLAPTCEQFVSRNPSAFTEAYWAINSVRVYLP